MNLRDQAIIITGASSGIGAATAIACARAGMHLVLGGRDGTRLGKVADAVAGLGRASMTVVGDVCEPDHSHRLIETANTRFGGFAAVFANAGFGQHQPILDFTDADIRRCFDVNFFSTLELLRGASRELIARGQGGRLLMCSSCVSKITLAGHGIYSATKAAQNHLCGAMRMELEDLGILVTSVHPIMTRTPYFDTAARISHPLYAATRSVSVTPRWLIQTPERVAAAVVNCLRSDRPPRELWTSGVVRAAAAAMVLVPSLMDHLMRRHLRRASPLLRVSDRPGTLRA